MEQHKFVWIFNMNRVGKVEMKDDGITMVKLSDDVSIIHNSNTQNEMKLSFPDRSYIIPGKEEISNIITLIKTKNVQSLREFADLHLEETERK